MAETLEQLAAVKFCFLLEEMVVMFETAYNEAALGKTQVYKWLSRFTNGELSLADQPRSGRPLTSRTDENITRIRELILEDSRRAIDEPVDSSGVSCSSRQRILREVLQMKKVAAKFVPHKASSMKQFLTRNSMTQLIHPPYSPDLAPCGLF
jgi:hypothetical protein